MILTIIVTYNGENYIEDCINGLIPQTLKTDILLVDNASSDRTCEIVQNKFPNVKIIQAGYNSGFAHGNNVGIQYAIEKNYEYVLLLNEDTIVEKNLIETLHKYANKYTATTPKIYMNAQKTKVWYGAGKLDFENRIAINCQPIYVNERCEVSFMTGCCMFIHTDVFKRVGLFDEKFFMYYEDTDLSARMYENGIKMIYIPEVNIWHRMQGKAEKNYYIYYMRRNKMYFFFKHAKIFHLKKIIFFMKELIDVLNPRNAYDISFQKESLDAFKDFAFGKMGMIKK